MVGRTILLVALCVATTLSGCTRTRTIDTGAAAREQMVPTELVPRSRPWVPDIPVPLQFELDQGSSRSWASGGVRVVQHRYTGPSEKWAVGRFYQRHMKGAGWISASDRMILGAISLRFVKGSERCEVEIRDSKWAGTEVNVHIYPETNTAAPAQY